MTALPLIVMLCVLLAALVIRGVAGKGGRLGIAVWPRFAQHGVAS